MGSLFILFPALHRSLYCFISLRAKPSLWIDPRPVLSVALLISITLNLFFIDARAAIAIFPLIFVVAVTTLFLVVSGGIKEVRVAICRVLETIYPFIRLSDTLRTQVYQYRS